MTLHLRCRMLGHFQYHQLFVMLLQPKTFTEQEPPCAAFTSTTLRLMPLNVCWILPIQAVGCNYIVKQGLCTRENKACLWEGPQASRCLYNRRCRQPFSSCWHAYRRMHARRVPPTGTPKAHSNIQCSCSYTKYFMRRCSPGDTELQSSPRLDSCFTLCLSTRVSRRALVQNNRKVRQALLINTVVFISRTTSLQLPCSLRLDLNLHAWKEGSSSKCSASYSKAAQYSCTLREGLSDCLRLNSTVRNMEYCKCLLWSVHKLQ